MDRINQNIKILFFGDVNGKIGRDGLKKALPKLTAKWQPDLILANGENLAHGLGATETTILEMQAAGINYFTGGNHLWDKPQIEELLRQPNNPIISPSNYIGSHFSPGEKIIHFKQFKLLIINLVGRVFVDEQNEYSCPFKMLDSLLKKYATEKLNGIIVDFHAEATSEKEALGWHADGRISALFGTHTHVQTSDAVIKAQGTAYITDLGMVGAANSIIGTKIETTLPAFLNQTKFSCDIPETGPAKINGVFIEIDPKTSLAQSIQPFNLTTAI